VPVVVVDPGIEGFGSVAGILVGEAIGPFSQCRLDEALGLAVGLGPVGAGELVLDAELTASGGEFARVEGAPVVGQNPVQP